MLADIAKQCASAPAKAPIQSSRLHLNRTCIESYFASRNSPPPAFLQPDVPDLFDKAFSVRPDQDASISTQDERRASRSEDECLLAGGGGPCGHGGRLQCFPLAAMGYLAFPNYGLAEQGTQTDPAPPPPPRNRVPQVDTRRVVKEIVIAKDPPRTKDTGRERQNGSHPAEKERRKESGEAD